MPQHSSPFVVAIKNGHAQIGFHDRQMKALICFPPLLPLSTALLLVSPSLLTFFHSILQSCLGLACHPASEEKEEIVSEVGGGGGD